MDATQGCVAKGLFLLGNFRRAQAPYGGNRRPVAKFNNMRAFHRGFSPTSPGRCLFQGLPGQCRSGKLFGRLACWSVQGLALAERL